MKYSQAIKSISYLKSNMAKVVREVSSGQGTMIITQNGEAKMVVQDIRVYEDTQESLAMLKILAEGATNVRKGKVKTAATAFDDITHRIENMRK